MLCRIVLNNKLQARNIYLKLLDTLTEKRSSLCFLLKKRQRYKGTIFYTQNNKYLVFKTKNITSEIFLTNVKNNLCASAHIAK